MSAATFRLATVEQLRRQELETTARDLHAAQTSVRAAQARRDDLLQRLHAERRHPRVAYELELESVYRFRLRGDLAEVDEELTGLRRDLARRRDAWLQARARLHAVQTLHERFRRKRAAELQRLEQRELDDFAGTRRSRQSVPCEHGGNRG